MHNQHKQMSGTALVTALVLLVALTIVSLSGMQATSVQLQISGNDEATVEAYQIAQSAVDAVLEDTPGNLAVGNENIKVCAVPGPDCDQVALTLNGTMFGSEGIQAKVELLNSNVKLRTGKGGNSVKQFKYAAFKISGQYDATSNNRGRATVVQGFYRLIKDGPQ